MPPSTDVLADKNARELVEARAKQLQAYVSAALRLVQRLGAPPVTYGTPFPYPLYPHSLSAWPGALQLSPFPYPLYPHSLLVWSSALQLSMFRP